MSRKEDAAYTKFVHDITEDVLAQGIYSDQGLWRLFQRHVTANEGQLNMVSGVGRALGMLSAGAISVTVVAFLFIAGPDAR